MSKATSVIVEFANPVRECGWCGLLYSDDRMEYHEWNHAGSKYYLTGGLFDLPATVYVVFNNEGSWVCT